MEESSSHKKNGFHNLWTATLMYGGSNSSRMTVDSSLMKVGLSRAPDKGCVQGLRSANEKGKQGQKNTPRSDLLLHNQPCLFF